MSVGWSSKDPARILVTGCSSGIGRALCTVLHDRGHHVIATARESAQLTGVPAHAHIDLDVTNDASIAAAASAAGPVDVLINNAGVTAWAPLETMPIDTAKHVFDTNVWGTLRMCQALLPSMRAAGRGRVINVSSAALRGYPLLGLYVASKIAMEALSESMRLELAAFGVDVILAEPAAVVSSFGQNRMPVMVDDPSYRELTERAFRYLQGLRGTVLTSEEAAGAIADLVELDSPPLRVPIGEDAERIAAERHSVGDEQFERSILSAL
ncbi:SDR family oxidoreductase [Dactylosporangium sp. AC04546]|uniref:SDR family oxidoreductase n=1 Tax=Dactylosporangium sp. AC04546 TaxID=2862460 RepID=UPI001EE04DC5|nr:SDR family oxidoreductase [Dactylosporangium sp. AC04546]WVK86956.1 SDR family oxidoreductase [Dactylosporangium sp. AC04546]